MMTKKKLMMFATACVVVCSSVSSALAVQDQSVAWKFKTGDRFQVTFDQESIVTTSFNLIERKIGTEIKLVMEWEVMGVTDEDVATLRQTIQDISMVMTAPTNTGAQEIKVDSSVEGATKKSVAKDMWAQIKPLIGATFDVQMLANGQVESVDATDETKEVIRTANGSMQLRKLLTPEGLKELFGQSIVVLPKSSFAKGDSWTAARKASTDVGEFSTSETYTFDGEVDRSGTAVQQISVVTETVQDNASDSKNKLIKSEGKGALAFDPAQGIFVGSQFVNDLTFDREYRDSSIKTHTQSNVRMRLEIISQ